MEHKDYKIPTNKKLASILILIAILLCIGILIVISCSFRNESEPEDLMQVSCSFNSYEIQKHTRSTSYDLLLISDAYDLPFRIAFFDGYKEQFSPEVFCTGDTYSIMVSHRKSYYEIYSCSNAIGDVIMTKRAAYTNSQLTAGIISTVFLHFFIIFLGMMLLIVHRPNLFSDRVKRFFFGKRKTI